MDDFAIHLEPLPRHYPHALPVQNIGHIARKIDWVRDTFSTFNFSFILRGRGEYRTRGKSWVVEAPCVITQWPGVYAEYGPGEFWEELFFIYRPESQELLERRRFADIDRPVWSIREIGPTRRRLGELRELLQDPQAFGRADEIDRVCEHMVLESLISESRPSLTPVDKLIQTIRAFVEDHYREPMDFDFLAAEQGLSPATFRRHWARHVSVPPGQYVTHLRLRQACRFLVETDLSIGQIAQAVGYDDALYFSRRFHKVLGETASSYRKRNLLHITLPEA